jgi:hypothetical protein
MFQGGLSMTKKISANYLLSLSTLLSSLSLFISLTIWPIYADSGSKPDEMDQIGVKIEMIRAHVQKYGNVHPEMNNKLRQLKKKFSAGVSLKECCQYCHADKVASHGSLVPPSPGLSGASRGGGEDER